MTKISPPHLAAEPRRLKSKREALERQKRLRARTGSLYDFIPNPTSSASVGCGDVVLRHQLRVREIPKCGTWWCVAYFEYFYIRLKGSFSMSGCAARLDLHFPKHQMATYNVLNRKAGAKLRHVRLSRFVTALDLPSHFRF